MKAESKQYYLVLLSMVLGLIIISSIAHDKTISFGKVNIDLLVLIAFAYGFLGLAVPKLMIHVIKGISFIQHKIGKALTAILLAIVFYLFLTPIAFFANLSKKKKTKTDSAFVDRNITYEKESFEKAF